MHDHSTCDHHRPASYGPAFAVGALLNTAFVICEVGFGLANHSLSLLADAGHNLGDVMGLLMGWMAVALSLRPATSRRTYGFRKSSVLAALGNSSVLMIGVGAIAVEAVRRFSEPLAISGTVVMEVAGLGILINGGTALMFAKSRKHDINREAAYMHMLMDAVVAAGVVVAGLIIRLTHWAWIDPTMSLLLAILVAVGSWRMLRRSVDLALDAVPDSIDPQAVREYLEKLPGVDNVMDLHIWAISTTENALTAHLLAPGGLIDRRLSDVEHELVHEFGIHHSTIQLEDAFGRSCTLA